MKAIFFLILFTTVAQAGTVTRREFVKDGVTYIEETNIGKNGNVSHNVYPKPGKDDAKLDAEMRAIENAPMPTPRPRKEKATARRGGITRAQAKKLQEAVAACKPFELNAPHPLFEDFTIEYKVHGVEQGKCKFTQTMPAQEIQICRLTESQRKNFQKYMGDASVCPITKSEEQNK